MLHLVAAILQSYINFLIIQLLLHLESLPPDLLLLESLQESYLQGIR